jgi:hypothetical protein
MFGKFDKAGRMEYLWKRNKLVCRNSTGSRHQIQNLKKYRVVDTQGLRQQETARFLVSAHLLSDSQKYNVAALKSSRKVNNSLSWQGTRQGQTEQNA